MDSALDKKRSDKLARVRENQRKSRARRQDHLRDLEEKVFSLQKELDRRDVEHRLAVQRFEAENRKLRDVLSASGVTANALEAYLRRVDNPEMAQKVAIPALQRPVPEAHLQIGGTSCTQLSSCARPISDEEVVPSDDPEHIVTTTDEPKSTEPATVSEKAEESQTPQVHPFCACPEEGPESLPINERILNTTFCAIAEKLVDQYNSRGIDVSEIRQKLREGFFRGTSEEGCRVQNQILFQVLDEISGD
ncbi:hypothetical protein BDW59DRAFT_171698 [Aspergillus cavernicola]|uniref:BZIP domain-containing protein n=1 Tax=Aspergillus cavernicola TaxID=176166 RepID=A0ABR4IJ58_9EURO